MRSLSGALCAALLAGGCATGITFPNLPENDVKVVQGKLVLPEGRGPFPAVVILHGCGGLRPNGDMWARFLRSQGYASIVLDGFSPRGVSQICTQLDRVPAYARVMDAYAALRYLAARPEVDADRIAVMGFSNGGSVVLNAATDYWTQRMAAASFRAAISLYPPCPADPATYGVPTLILIGALDDWTPAWRCTNHVERMASTGVELKIYPGGHHGFDNAQQPTVYLPHVSNRLSPTGRGATVGGDARLTARAKQDVLAFLRLHLAEK